MDTSDLLKRGARALIVDLCKQLEEVSQLVPDLQKFARMLAHESLGGKPMGRASKKTLNGDRKAKLADQLIAARKARKPGSGRKPYNAAELADMKRRMAARWRTAKKLGYTGRTTPSNATIEQLKLKAKGTNGKQHAADQRAAE